MEADGRQASRCAAVLDSEVTPAEPVISAQAIQAVAAMQKGLVVDLDSTLAAAAAPCLS